MAPKDLGGCWQRRKRERERERGGRGRKIDREREDSNPSLMSLGFHVIILNSGWYEGQCIIGIVFGMIYY